MNGVDISSWQRGLPASALNQNNFAILKISEGQGWRDPCFDEFYDAATIPLGAYVYSHATSEADAIAEAKYALKLLEGRALPLGVYMDVEESKQLVLDNLAAIVDAFCFAIRQGGYKAGAYGSAGQLWARVSPLTFNGYVWAASWGAEPRFACDIWQYSSDTRLDGYRGPVDGDKAMSERMQALIAGQPAPDKPSDDDQAATFSINGVPVLQEGDFGDAVKAMQGELLALGYSCGGSKDWRGVEKADGIFGPVTAESVRSYQRARGLNDNGICGPKTRAFLLGVKQ